MHHAIRYGLPLAVCLTIGVILLMIAATPTPTPQPTQRVVPAPEHTVSPVPYSEPTTPAPTVTT